MNIGGRLLVLNHHMDINFVLELSTEEKFSLTRSKNILET